MLAPVSVIKKTAKQALNGKYLRAVIASGIVVCAWLCCNFLSSIISFATADFAAVIAMLIFNIFLIGPLFFGLIHFFFRLTYDAQDSPVIIFSYFGCAKKYRRALSLTLRLILRSAITAFVLFLPSLVLDFLSNGFIYEKMNIPMPFVMQHLGTASAFLKAIAFGVFVALMIKYYMAPYLLVADEDMHPAEALHMSSVLSRRTSLDFILLALSFTHYILASFLMLPIVFTVPYLVCAYAVHCRFAVTQYNLSIDALSKEKFYYNPM